MYIDPAANSYITQNLDYNNDMFRAPNPYSITVNTGARTMTLFRSGKAVKTYPIAIGKPATPTPKGNFRIINKAHNPGGPFGARWLGLNKKGYGIHGTNNPSSIGKAVSNGCIRTYNQNIIELYNTVPVGTPVRII
jgi:lipoprotein-anchoring transpeptidase ErfK/SrfK